MLLLALSLHLAASAQPFLFSKELLRDSLRLDKAMTQMAGDVLKKYQSDNRERYLDNTFRLQLLAGDYSGMRKSLDEMNLMQFNDSISRSATALHYRVFAAVLAAGVKGNDFNQFYEHCFNSTMQKLSEANQNLATRYFESSESELKQNWESTSRELQDSLNAEDAIRLCRAYLSWKTARETFTLARKIILRTEAEKYIIEDSILVPMPDGGRISVLVVRSRKNQEPLPVVMMYNIYAGKELMTCKEAVNYGYVGLVANTRGKGLSNDSIEPFEHDARDAWHIIDWISRQPWCNGKIGMYGGSYLGFSQWSSVKKLHSALKTIVPQVAVGAGVDYPMQNGIFMNYMLRWIHYVHDNRYTSDADFMHSEKWNDLFLRWFRTGRSFRSLDSMEGRPSTIFQRWLKHPVYDQYWKKMTPQKKEFARINIPVLSISGYWDDDQLGALHYYREHTRYNRNARHYLLLGPYDHGGAQFLPSATVSNYKVDSVALINIIDLVFAWFNHTLKDGPLPAILKDKVTFQLMGKNEWRSVPSLNKMADDTIRFYFSTEKTNAGYLLKTSRPSVKGFIAQNVDFRDREEAWLTPDEPGMGSYPHILDSTIRTEKHKLIFVSEPMEKPLAISGALMPEFRFSCNKKDVDLVLDLFEQTADGRYFALNRNMQRASLASDPSMRTLLSPGKIHTVAIPRTFVTCRQLQKGSRIVLVAGVNKSPVWQVNYGSGKDVSDETMADAVEKLEMKWYTDTCIKIPVIH